MELTYIFELSEPNKVANLLAIPAFAVEAKVTVEFKIEGKYYPATWDFPTEYPELEIISYTDLVITFYDEFRNRVFRVDTTADQLSTLIDFYGILGEHTADLECSCWEAYHEEN